MKPRIGAEAAGAAAGLAGAVRVAAQATDVASSGNGGVATASANGGAVSVGDVNSGGNVSNAIGIGDTSGAVPVDPVVYGGDCANATAIGVSVDGGTSIADASGGNYNLAFVS
jgi:hypothetical protein